MSNVEVAFENIPWPYPGVPRGATVLTARGTGVLREYMTGGRHTPYVLLDGADIHDTLIPYDGLIFRVLSTKDDDEEETREGAY